MKRTTFLIPILFCICISFLSGTEEAPLVQNSSFEGTLSHDSSLPLFWDLDSWKKDGSSSFSLDATKTRTGKTSAKLDISSADDARLVQNIAVKPNTLYRISAWIQTENISLDAVGPNISAEGIMQRSDSHLTTIPQNEWQQLVLWGKTGKHQTTLRLYLRLGFYGSIATGTVWFDDVEITEEEKAPQGKLVVALFPEPAKNNIFQSTTIPTLYVYFFMILIIVLYFFLHKHLTQTDHSLLSNTGKRAKSSIIIGISIFIVCKLLGAAFFRGYPADVSTFSAWALDIVKRGPAHFYQDGYFADYPPLYFYILGIVGSIANLFKIPANSPLFLLILKLPSIIADIGSAFMLYKIALHNKKAFAGILAAILIFLNPVYTMTSSFWGQVDSIFTMVLLFALSLLEKNKEDKNRNTYTYPIAGALYALAILLKPQSLLIAPIGLIALIKTKNIKEIGLTALAFILTAFVAALPFVYNKPPNFIFSLYISTLGSYNYVSLNAFNLYTLFGGNWAPATKTFLFLQAGTWAWILTISALSLILYIVAKAKRAGALLWGAATTYIAFFTLGPRMHERYLFPSLVLMLASTLYIQDKRLFRIFIAASTTAFLNVFVTLELFLRTNSSFIPHSNIILILCSIANPLILGYAIYTGWKIFIQNKILMPVIKDTDTTKQKKLSETKQNDEDDEKQTSRFHYYALFSVTLIALILGLSNLGSCSSPQHFWEAKNTGESAVFEFADTITISQTHWYAGLGTGEYRLEVSNDGHTWKELTTIRKNSYFQEFRWRKIPVSEQARFVQIIHLTGSLQLHELAFTDSQGNLLSPSFLRGTKESANLFDEQKTFTTVDLWYTGMYFDELYHAQSAWEQLQSRDATENTHPPLGKLIIALGVKIFGMNPFGWRCMGAIFGALMIPLIWIIAKKILRSPKAALVVSVLFCFDFMRFTQSRIATIDVYGVFFILASYAAFSYWINTNPTTKNRRTWFIPMLCTGIAIGLGAASKWIGLYADAGIFFMFIIHILLQTKKYYKKNPYQTSRWIVEQLLAAILCFIVIPLFLYTLAYIPYMLINGTGIMGMIANQKNMWNYHSRISETHPYSSQWYTWPFMGKPMWYYGGAENVAPAFASTIIIFGNPALWYPAAVSTIVCIIEYFVRVFKYFSAKKNPPSQALFFILVAIAAQFLPWAVIPRKLVFIYHYFATVPFITIAWVYVLQKILRYLKNKTGKDYSKVIFVSVCVLAILYFAGFYPVLTGTPFPRLWAEGLKHIFRPLYF